MNLQKYKLPILKTKRILINKNDNNDLSDLRLSILNIQKKIKLSKTPLKLGPRISFSVPENIIDNSKLNYKDNNNLEKINHENDLIKKFLYQNINKKKYLKPIKKISQNKSSINLNKNKYAFFFNESNEKDIIDDKNNSHNKTFLLYKKFNRNFSRNPNINKITNINKYLIKKNENDTNGNFIYDDYSEEQKESITFIINSNNSKEFFKKNLTKKYQDNQLYKNIDNNKNIDNFKFNGKKFDSPAIRNIHKIKYIQEIIQQKNKDNKDNNYLLKDKNKKNILKNINNDKYNYILKGKIKNMNDQINVTGKNLKNMDKLLISCLINSKNQFEVDTKNIFGDKYIFN